MSLHRWLQNLRSALTPGRGQRHPRRRGSLRAGTHRPTVEFLEDRCVPAMYGVTDLGMYSASDLNEAGQVVGYAFFEGLWSHAVLWDNGTMIDLGTLGGDYSEASGINDLGQVVGTAHLPSDATWHAFRVTPQGGVWYQDSDLDGRNDFMIDLGELPGGEYSAARDVNNAGQVVGDSGNRPFFWDPANGMVDLGVPPGFTYGAADSINASGQVTGNVWATDLMSTFLWDAANGFTVLGAGGYANGGASGINDAGQLVGVQWNESPEDQHAFLWTPDSPNGHTGSFTNLDSPFGLGNGATAINNAGRVVGFSQYVAEESNPYPRAVLWEFGAGTVDMVYLEDQQLPGSSVALEYTQAINNGGAIAVNSHDRSGYHRAYLLTPDRAGTPSIGIADAAVTEGHTGTRAATFTVTLSAASSQPVTVVYATAGGTATAGRDYQAASGTLTFAPGETSKTVTVPVNGDLLPERNETFVVNLSSPSNATIADGEAVGTIIDDDPTVSVTDASVAEGNGGARSVSFTITLSAPYYMPVTVNYATTDGTATAGSDYTAASGSVIIAAGQTSNTFTVQVTGDRLPEANETFFVNLGSPTNAAIADGAGVATIVDDEPRISIGDVTMKEGNGKKSTLFTFTVTLSAAYDQAVTVSYSTTNGTATTGDGDYVAITGTITFAPGEKTKTVTIEVKGDSKREANETFYLDLFGNSSNSLFTKNRGIGTILNDD